MLPQQEERDLCQLPPQSKQAAGQGQVLVTVTVFPQNQFLSDPGVPGVRSMGPVVSH